MKMRLRMRLLLTGNSKKEYNRKGTFESDEESIDTAVEYI